MESNETNTNNIVNSIPVDSANAPNIEINSNSLNTNNISQLNNSIANTNIINELNPILNTIINSNNIENNNNQNNQENNLNDNIQNTNQQLLERANNSLDILNRITNELTTIQARIQDHSNQINQMNNFENIRDLNLGDYGINRNPIVNRRVINISIINKVFSDFPFQDKFFLFSSGLALLIVCWLILLNINQEITLAYLENEEMYLNYLLINILIFIFSWDFYLFLQNFVFHSSPERREENKNSLKLKEILLFSPFWLYCVIKYSVPNYLSTIFDGFFIVFVSIQYKINFIFSIRLYKFINNKINNISNFHHDDNLGLMSKMRIHFMIITLYNVLFVSFLYLFLGESDLLYKFIILNKGLFLFFKHVEYLILTEIKHYNLISSVGIQEEFFLRHLTMKTNIKLITKFLLLFNYLFFSIILLFNGIFLFSFFMWFFIIRMIVKIVKLNKTLRNVKDFYKKLEAQFPLTEVEDENDECIICTETLKFARKLPCNHRFHLICLSRWIEKGHKSCPVCRKDLPIETVVNPSQQQESIWSFGFRLNSTLFSWLPNINLRIIRA